MKNAKIKTALAAVTLAAAAFATPLSASAQDYNRNCNDTTNGIAGGLIGGSVGAAIGEGIAGRGERTEGAILGAIIGGIAGAAIGDGASDCEKNNRNNSRSVTTRTQYPTQATTSNRVYQTAGYSTNRNTRNNRSFTSVSYRNDNNSNRLYQIDRQIDDLRREREYLRSQRNRSRNGRRTAERRLERIDCRLDELKFERKRVKKASHNRNDSRRGY